MANESNKVALAETSRVPASLAEDRAMREAVSSMPLLDVIENLCRQGCYTQPADSAEPGLTDTGAITAYADGLYTLAAHGRFRVVRSFGRMVCGYFPDDEPEPGVVDENGKAVACREDSPHAAESGCLTYIAMVRCNGGLGPWDEELLLEADTFAAACRMAVSRAEALGGVVVSLEQAE